MDNVPAPPPKERYTHREDGGTYEKLSVGDRPLMKVDTTSFWVEAVAYKDVSEDGPHKGQVYFTSKSRWDAKFKLK